MSNMIGMLDEEVRLTVEMTVTPAQALALKAMFEYWNALSRMGGSREVGFYVDGDGDFHPRVQVSTDRPLPELTADLREAAVARDSSGNRLYHHDEIAARLRNQQIGAMRQ